MPALALILLANAQLPCKAPGFLRWPLLGPQGPCWQCNRNLSKNRAEKLCLPQNEQRCVESARQPSPWVRQKTEICQRTELRSSVYRKINSGTFRAHSSRQRAPPGAKAATRICRCFTDTVLQAPQLPSQRAARPQHHWLSHCTGNGTNSIAQQPVLTGSFQTLRLLSSEPGIPVGTPLYCPTDPESHIYPYGLPTERGETFTTIGSSYVH